MLGLMGKLTSPKWLDEALRSRARTFMHSVNFRPEIIERDVAGEVHKLLLGNPTGKSWYGSLTDASPEMTFIRDHLVKPGDTVVECGAHHGAQTILLSRWAGPEGTVVAVEPSAENVRILRRNIELNELANVVVVEKALGAASGQVTINRLSNASIRSRGPGRVAVEAITLDELIADLGLRPNFVKIDVEGYEYDLLSGGRATIAAAERLFIEVHPRALGRYGKTFADLWTYVDADRFEIFIQPADDLPPTPYVRGYEPSERVHLFFTPRSMSA